MEASVRMLNNETWMANISQFQVSESWKCIKPKLSSFFEILDKKLEDRKIEMNLCRK